MPTLTSKHLERLTEMYQGYPPYEKWRGAPSLLKEMQKEHRRLAVRDMNRLPAGYAMRQTARDTVGGSWTVYTVTVREGAKAVPVGSLWDDSAGWSCAYEYGLPAGTGEALGQGWGGSRERRVDAARALIAYHERALKKRAEAAGR